MTSLISSLFGKFDSDKVIKKMLATDGPVIVDVVVEKTENCFPMVPSGAAHNEMVLSADDEAGEVSEDAATLL